MASNDSFMNDLSDEYLVCRDRSIGHDWDVNLPFQLSRKLRSGHEMIRVSRCARCATERQETFQQTARTIVKTKARYSYPRGYSDTGIGRVSNADVWLEQLRRVKPRPMPRERLRVVPSAS